MAATHWVYTSLRQPAEVNTKHHKWGPFVGAKWEHLAVDGKCAGLNTSECQGYAVWQAGCRTQTQDS